jgi:hypothetical protein
MIADLLIGLILSAVGVYFGFGLNSILIFLASFFLDFDIPVNELIRIFIKKEKRFSLVGLVDKKSYMHRFIFHLPLIVLPLSFLAGLAYQNWLFGILIALAILLHLIHDTIDKNFDGVSWLWPFSKNSYKLRNFRWEIKTRSMLEEEAKSKKTQSAKQIFWDNKF